MTVELTLPASQGGVNYYRPYLAVWLENTKDMSAAGTLAVWYDQRIKDNQGKTWLRHLRTWWRKAGAELSLPVDGISGATRAAGQQVLHYDAKNQTLASLPDGNYNLVVEVARERGGHETVRLPFQWASSAVSSKGLIKAQGDVELGDVVLRITP
jgi:hypothetical protein